jgi:hypothetical protein
LAPWGTHVGRDLGERLARGGLLEAEVAEGAERLGVLLDGGWTEMTAAVAGAVGVEEGETPLGVALDDESTRVGCPMMSSAQGSHI